MDSLKLLPKNDESSTHLPLLQRKKKTNEERLEKQNKN